MMDDTAVKQNDSATEKALQAAADLLAPWSQESAYPEDNRLDVVIEPADLTAAITALHEARWGYLAAITGLDLLNPDKPEEESRLVALYHFCQGAAITTLRLHLDREQAVVATICPIIPSAGVFERELMEMLGVTVEQTPIADKLYLPEEWPDDQYPLRKDFVLEQG